LRKALVQAGKGSLEPVEIPSEDGRDYIGPETVGMLGEARSKCRRVLGILGRSSPASSPKRAQRKIDQGSDGKGALPGSQWVCGYRASPPQWK